MKRLYIICEGPTEVEFCHDVLYPYFIHRNLVIIPILIKKAGGIIPWPGIKHQAEILLKQDPACFVTLLIDYYGLYPKHKFPQWDEAEAIVNRAERMDRLEQAMKNDMDADLNHRFLPYIQLHEFEGLLFNNMQVFDNSFTPDEFTNRQELLNTINQHPNPEEINNRPEYAPSKRLLRLIKGYDKIVFGACLAVDIGLVRLRAKSPRFSEWITKIENL